VFQDDYTGTSLRRPRLTAVRDLVQQGLVQAVIVHDIDRLSRKLAHQLLLTEEFEQAGVCLHSVTMPDGARTPEQHLLANVKGIIAEYERAKILERTARGRQGRARAGHVPPGRQLLGHRYIKHADKGAHYEVDPEEAALVRHIFTLYLDHGLSQDAIAARLTRERVPTPGERRPGGPRRKNPPGVWHQSAIGDILRNTAYIGVLYDGKTQNQPGTQNPDRKTRHRRLLREQWTPIAIPPSLDQATFEAAQARMRVNVQQARRKRKHDYLLAAGCAAGNVAVP
jgi:site-specific DNA recombinase